MSHDPLTWYDAHAPDLAKTYESLDAATLHAWLSDLLPRAGATALDVGAGTGRDATWLASRGLEVVAAEPSKAMREEALGLRPESNVRWVDDALPGLPQTLRTGVRFDLILLSAVWMHVPEAQRAQAFHTLMTLLKPGGLLAITLRLGPAAEERGMHPVSEAEIERFTLAHGAFVERRVEARDRLDRGEVSWVQMAIRGPTNGNQKLTMSSWG